MKDKKQLPVDLVIFQLDNMTDLLRHVEDVAEFHTLPLKQTNIGNHIS